MILDLGGTNLYTGRVLYMVYPGETGRSVAEALDINSLPKPGKAAELMLGFFGTIDHNSRLSKPAHQLLSQQHISFDMTNRPAFFAQYYLDAYVWQQMANNGNATTIPAFNDQINLCAPVVRPSNFGEAEQVVSMTNVNYGYKQGPKTNLFFAYVPREGHTLFYYEKNTDSLDLYRQPGRLNSLKEWKGRSMDVTDWLEGNTKPRIAQWRKISRTQYKLQAEFLANNISFAELLHFLNISS